MKKVLILGGTGFIGLNLTEHLLTKKNCYDITLCGQERVAALQKKTKIFLKLTKIPKNIHFAQVNVCDEKQVTQVAKNKTIIINLAGYSGAVNSIEYPEKAVNINTIGHLNILEAAKNFNKKAIIILAGSRLEYGPVKKLPVSVDQVPVPNTIYGSSKYMATKYSQMYHSLYGLKTITLRIGNPFGPQLPPTSTSYNLINHFIHVTKNGKPITIFGTGKQKRDYIYVEDLCRAIEKTFDNKKIFGRVLNIGSGRGTSILTMAQMIIKKNSRGKINKVSWPPSWRSVETGDFYFDIKPAQKILKWKPLSTLEKGIKKVIRSV